LALLVVGGGRNNKGGSKMAKGCEHCGLRAKYDKNPASLLGRIWRWHAGWCPGWNRYMGSLPPEERLRLAERYGMEKHKR
jgi:hypothetical protein